MREEQQYEAGPTDGTGKSGVNSDVNELEDIFPDGELQDEAELDEIYALLRTYGDRANESVELPKYTDQELRDHFEESTTRTEMSRPNPQQHPLQVTKEQIAKLRYLLSALSDESEKKPLKRFPTVYWEAIRDVFSESADFHQAGSVTHHTRVKELLDADIVPVIPMYVCEHEGESSGFLTPSRRGVRWLKSPQPWDEVHDPAVGSGAFLQAAHEAIRTELARAAPYRYVLVHFATDDAPEPCEFARPALYDWSVRLWPQTGSTFGDRLAAARIAKWSQARRARIAEPAAVLWVYDPSQPPKEPEAATLVPLPAGLTPAANASDRLWDWSVKLGQLFVGEISETGKSRLGD
ncbi:hypothetical protein ACLQ16_03985 [Streptomyces albidoflavus]|uniref:hypothetical protein n=1 Tax=Streptomyces albidoflavus TaxID=1886 RepID=UPI00118220AB|nr:hypothetical protein [Streptomyces albidoflavus]